MRSSRSIAHCCLFAFAICLAVEFRPALAETEDSRSNKSAVDVTRRRIQRIPPGTVINETEGDGDRRLVLLAKSRLGSGDVEQTPTIVRRYVGMFHLAVVADVLADHDSGVARYQLARVAVGLCLPINGENVVLTSTTHDQVGAKLDFVAKKILSASEDNLNEVVQVARHRTLVIFDAQAIVLSNGKHQDGVIRHMVWIDPRSGQLGSLVWQLNSQHQMLQPVIQALPPNFVEDRVVNVMTSEFTLGIPSDRAFAIVEIPQGKPIEVSPKLAELAATRQFTPRRLAQLSRELNAAISR